MMGLRRWIWLGVAAVLVGTAGANGPDQSPRPKPRPGPDRVVEVIDLSRSPDPAPVPGLRPKPRPGQAHMKPEFEQAEVTGLARRPKPRPAPPSLIKAQIVAPPAVPAVPATRQPVKLTDGALETVCGDPDLRGRALPAIKGDLPGCGLARPVALSVVDGVALSRPATLHCDTAKALKRWINRGVRPTMGRLGGGVVELKVAADYACRTRNNLPNAKLSEHAKGRAIDISAFRLKNGVELTVFEGWTNKTQSRLLQSIHAEACGPFKTVLGPEADRFHQDHFHLDTADRRSAYCK